VNIMGVILAGGRSTRMKGLNKALVSLAGTTLLSRVIDRLLPQVQGVVVNANIPLPGITCPVISDCQPDFPGPLTGIVTAFHWLQQQHADFDALVVAPCDGPFLPLDLVARLQWALVDQNAQVACSRYGGRAQPTFSLWRRDTAVAAASSLERQGGLKALMAGLDAVFVDWPEAAVDPFYNINTPSDLAEAEKILELVV
jgi:molybdenum cofactor guanylyltransferase